MSIREKFCKEGNITEIARDISRLMMKNFKSVFESYEELESEIAVILLEKRGTICRKKEVNLSLLTIIVRNALIDKFFRSRKFNELVFSEFEGNGNSLDTVDEGELSPLSLINVNEAVRLVKGSLSKNELETLCYYLHSVLYRKEENPFLRGKSKDAKYKAWSRLRPKVSELLSPFRFSDAEMRLFSEILLSEFLRKNRF